MDRKYVLMLVVVFLLVLAVVPVRAQDGPKGELDYLLARGGMLLNCEAAELDLPDYAYMISFDHGLGEPGNNIAGFARNGEIYTFDEPLLFQVNDYVPAGMCWARLAVGPDNTMYLQIWWENEPDKLLIVLGKAVFQGNLPDDN